MSSEPGCRSAPVSAAKRKRTLVLMAAGFVAAAAGAPMEAASQSWATLQVSRELQDERPVDVSVRYSAGRLGLSGEDTSRLYDARLRYDEAAFAPLHRYEEGRLAVGVERTSRWRFPTSGSASAEMDMVLSTRVPLALEIELGAARADIDLGGLRLETFELHAGASETTLRISSPNPQPIELARMKVGAAALDVESLGNLNAGEIVVEGGFGHLRLDLGGLQRPETRVRAKVGLGNLELRIPEEVGVRLVRSTFLSSLDAPGLRPGEDEALYSENWSDAPLRVDLNVEAALGSVSVIRY